MGAAPRGGPRPVAGVVLRAGRGRRACSRCGSSRARDTSTLVGKSTRQLRGDGALQRALRRRRGLRARSREPVDALVADRRPRRVLGLEGCLSGNVPAGATPRGGRDGPCAQLARDKPVKVVFGPGTFLNESVRQIADEFSAPDARARRSATQRAGARPSSSRAARGYSAARGASSSRKQAARARQRRVPPQRPAARAALRPGIDSLPPQLDDPNFVSRLVFDPRKPAGTPKARFAYLFPNEGRGADPGAPEARPHARRSASGDRATSARAVAMPDWQLSAGAATSSPARRWSSTTSPSSHPRSIVVLLIVAALLVMALTLALVFRARLRLLPLAVALGAAALTFGALSLAGASLTMASIAVLPVLIGLAVDYAIQLQSRVAGGGAAAARRRRRSPRAARRRSSPPRARPRPASSCCCSRPCRWCAASACCSSSASCRAASAR